MRKYITIFSITYLVATVFFILFSYLLRSRISDGFNIAAVFCSGFLTGHIFFKDHRRVPTKEELSHFAKYSLLPVLLVISIVVMYLISIFAAHAIIAFIMNPRYLALVIICAMLFLLLYYFLIRYSFAWYVRIAAKKKYTVPIQSVQSIPEAASLPKEPRIGVDEIISAWKAASRLSQILQRVQVGLVVLCVVALIAVILVTFMRGPFGLGICLGLVVMFGGFGISILNRKAQQVFFKAEVIRRSVERLTAERLGTNVVGVTEEAQQPKIPLTIGFANLSGENLSAIASEDAVALSPLFARSKVVAAHQIPSAEVLFVYAILNEDGTIQGPTPSGIRQIVQLTNAAIIILASPNSSGSIQNAASLPGPKTANIVFTLHRNGSGFSQFFRELFEKMRDGKDMLTAWVELAPQNPNANLSHAPQTILLAEGGKIVFPR